MSSVGNIGVSYHAAAMFDPRATPYTFYHLQLQDTPWHERYHRSKARSKRMVVILTTAATAAIQERGLGQGLQEL